MFNSPATTQIYTLSLHDALPISVDATADFGATGDRGSPLPGRGRRGARPRRADRARGVRARARPRRRDRKSTRLNSSHTVISYAVFCLKKKKKEKKTKLKDQNQV